MNELIYVLAENYASAMNFARERGLDPSRIVNVDRREKLLGLRGAKIYVLNRALRRENFAELMETAMANRLDIVRLWMG